MIGELIFGIIGVAIGIVLFVASIVISDDTLIGSVVILLVSLSLSGLSIWAISDFSDKQNKNHDYIKIENIKEIQIDTVYTTIKNNTDTTFVINYKL